jgi:poly-gamma-glutamate synthesis protein (capsule biosynthesis protein)
VVRRAGGALLLTLALAACSQTEAAAPTPTPTPSAPPVPRPSPTPSPTKPRPAVSKHPVTIAFGGDVHFEGAVRRHLLDDPATVFGDIAATLRKADLAMVNLETAITERGTAQEKEYVFRAPASAFAALDAAGIDVVTNANNHGMDYGPVGLQDTLAAAKRARFPLVGSGQDEVEAYAPWVARVRGTRVAFLGASQVIAPELVKEWTAGPSHPGLASAYRVERLTRAVRDARKVADVVVVYVHWGEERNSCPTDRQRTLARQLAEAGADVVVGSHAHVVQGAGRLGDTYVAYGLGNFLFYNGGPTSVLTLTIDKGEVTRVKRTPAVISSGWTSPLTGPAAVRERERQEALHACAFG